MRGTLHAMMQIKAKHWRLYCHAGGIAAIPAAAVLMSGVGGELLHMLSFAFIVLLGVSGGLVALLMRFGIVNFVYTPRERTRWMFRMQKQCAIMEKDIWGSLFSDEYYRTYLGTKTGEEDRGQD